MAGVAGGLADHLGLDVVLVRVAFVALTVAGGSGVLLYVGYWAVVPQARDASGAKPASDHGESRVRLAALSALALGCLLVVRGLGRGLPDAVLWPALLAGAGVVVLWRQADDAQRARWAQVPGLRGRTASSPLLRTAAAVARLAAGAALVLAGLTGFLATNAELRQARDGLLAAAVVLAGVALITGPWLLRLGADLREERRERIRVQERADVAGHVHDSVLQTLALIQRHVEDPREVQRLARGQERELRTWLYRPAAAARGEHVAAAVEAAAAEVEELHGVPVDVVVVGDAPVDEALSALVLASREAMTNAAKFSGAGSISVYVEVEPDRVTVFVRDTGTGFDPEAVPSDRYGVAQSILGRMQRHGGSATVRSRPGAGTEVEIAVPRVRR